MAVVWYIRMPRMVVGLLVGAALGISGAVMQGIFSNPLADPGIIGVSSGAATGAVLSIALGWATESMFVMPAFAFCGSVCAVSLTVFLAMRNGKIPVMTLLLAGVAVGMLLGAVTSGLLTFMNEQKLQQYLFWMVGGLDYRRWEHVYMAIGPVSIGIVIMLALSRHLNILVLGETEAKAVGMPVLPFRMGLLFVAAMTIDSHEEMSSFSTYVLVPMSFLCGTFFKADSFPEIIKWSLSILPLTPASSALRAAANKMPVEWHWPVIMAIYFLIFFSYACHLLKMKKEE